MSTTLARFLVCLVPVIAVSIASAQPEPSASDAARAGEQPLSDNSTVHIDESSVDYWIEMLGTPRFRDRQRAEAQLESLGLAAYEALLSRTNDPDIEVRLRASRLVKKLQASFLSRDIDPALRSFLANYTDQDIDIRELAIAGLASLLPQQAVPELTRIARFESNERLSKVAALALLSHVCPSPPDTETFVAGIRTNVGTGDRPAVVWLRLFADLLEGRVVDAVTTWETWIADEELVLQREAGEMTSRKIVQTMRRLLADMHQMEQRPQQARSVRLAISRERMAESNQVFEWMNWLLQRSAWQSVIDLSEQQPTHFERDAILLYGVAESHLRLSGEGSDSAAWDETLLRAVTTNAAAEDSQRHAVAAFLEDQRGRFEWAEREYRNLIDHADKSSIYRANAFLRLAGMYHNRQQELAAAEILEQLLEEVDKIEETKHAFVDQMEGNVASTTARMHLYRALHEQQVGNAAQQRAALQKALAFDPTESDVLIAIHQLEGTDDAWRQAAQRAVRDATDRLQRTIQRRRREAEVSSPEKAARSQRVLASALNHLAWLVSNTEGDYEEALRLSRQSLEIRPGDGGLLDTLARCYFSLGELENALKYQRWAVQRSPHELQIRRQLESFEQAHAANTSSLEP